ncbi:MAG: class II aldolase/adducin family protein [Nitrososphaerota archaeon]|nr:class II aldolase/adducin family protein [Candidatus Bathyarchaeota archaeon]MDW8023677.1 class II aldolase/adducin family protein [Nitrososphaerota archaeon]
MERYVGVKFRTKFLRREPPEDERIAELAKWCKVFHLHGLAPVVDGKSMGNLSFRLAGGLNEFIITASGLGPKDSLSPESFVKVVDCDVESRTVYVHGVREPSSESILHYRIYSLRQDAHAVFHGHDTAITRHAKELGAVETKEWKPYGSLELVKSVEEVLDGNKFLVMKKHGFISIGASMEEAGKLALEKKKVAEGLSK